MKCQIIYDPSYPKYILLPFICVQIETDVRKARYFYFCKCYDVKLTILV